MEREKISRKRPAQATDRESAVEKDGIFMQQYIENHMRHLLGVARECENLKCAFDQIEELVNSGAFDEGDTLDNLADEIEYFCDIWESNSTEIYDVNRERSPSPSAYGSSTAEGELPSVPAKEQDGNSSVEVSQSQALTIHHVSPQKESVPITQSFFKPSSVLASAAALQLGVTSSEGSFTKLSESVERAAVSKAATASSVTRSAPTLSKLLEMPPSVPGKLPSLPSLYDTAYTPVQTPSQTSAVNKRKTENRQASCNESGGMWQFGLKSVEESKEKKENVKACETENDTGSVQSTSSIVDTHKQKSNISPLCEGEKDKVKTKQSVSSQENVEDNVDSTPDTEVLSSDSSSVSSDNNERSGIENATAVLNQKEVAVNESHDKLGNETSSGKDIQITENLDSDTINVELESSTEDVGIVSCALEYGDSEENIALKQIPAINITEGVVTREDSDTPTEESSNPNPDLTFEISKALTHPEDSDSNNFSESAPEPSSASLDSVQKVSDEKIHSKAISSRGKFTAFEFDLESNDANDIDNAEDITFQDDTEHSKKDSSARPASPATSSSGISESAVMQSSEIVDMQLEKIESSPGKKSTGSNKTDTRPSSQDNQSSQKTSSSLDCFPSSPENNDFLSLDSSSLQKPSASEIESSLAKRRQRKKNAKQLPSSAQKVIPDMDLDESSAVLSTPKSKSSSESMKDSQTEKQLHGNKSSSRKLAMKKDSVSPSSPLTPPSKRQKTYSSPVLPSDESTHSEDSAMDLQQRRLNSKPTVVLKDCGNELAKHREDSDQGLSGSSVGGKFHVPSGTKKPDSKSPVPTSQTRLQQQQDSAKKKVSSRRGRRGGRTVPKTSRKSSPENLSDSQNNESSPRKMLLSDSPDASKSTVLKEANESSKDADSASDSEKMQAKTSLKHVVPRGGRRGRRGRGRNPTRTKAESDKKGSTDNQELDEEASKIDLKEYVRIKQENQGSDRDPSPKISKEESFESDPETDRKHEDDDSNLSLPASASPMTSDDSYRVKDVKDSYSKQLSPQSSGPASQRSIVTPTTSDRESSDESSDDSDESVRTANSNENTGKQVPKGKRVKKDNEYKRWKKSICMIWREASYHKFANVFTQKVTDDVAPGYQSIVNRPVDLTLIKKQIDSGQITTTERFHHQVLLMFQNAVMYNSSDHDVYQMATEMQADVNNLILDYRYTQLDIDDKIKEPAVPPALRAGRQAKPQLKPQR